MGLLGGSDQPGGTEEGRTCTQVAWLTEVLPLKPSYRSTQKNGQQGCACVVGLVGIREREERVWAVAMGDSWDWVLSVVCPSCPGYGDCRETSD